MQDTKWRDLKEFSGYIVSDQGHIAKIAKPRPNEKGYLRASITTNNKVKRPFVHALMAKTWLQNPSNKATVNHKNRNIHDNRLGNLEWMTNAENLAHKYSTNRVLINTDHLINCIENESWVCLKGFKNYIISDQGRLAKLILPWPNERGYLKTKFCENFIRVDRYVHRIVAATWCENPNNLETVNHKNYNNQDNRACNLEWMSGRDNTKHSFLNPKPRKIKDSRGIKHHKCKLTEAEVIEIRSMYDKGVTCKNIADLFGVTNTLISYIGLRKIWTHIPDKSYVHRIDRPENRYSKRGIENKKSKLTDVQVHQIRKRYDDGEAHKIIALDFPVNSSTVGKIGLRQIWKHLA